MKRIIFTTTVIVSHAVCLITNPFVASSEEPHAVEAAQKEIIKLSSKTATPKTLHLTKADGSVFFVNVTKESLLTLDIDYQQRRAHCASSNMKFGEDGHMRTTAPIGPQDFAIMCFPEKGTYQFSAYGISDNGEPITGSIIVE